MRTSPARRLVALVALVVASPIVVAARPARAGDAAAAEALFLEGKKLMDQGHYADACPKFAESNRLDRGAGTLIHLGDCYEKNKQTASAWATYREAASAAQAIHRAEWEKLARDRSAALEPKLAKLVVRVPKETPKLVVRRDHTEIAKPSWGVETPVDAGPHALEASAPGHRPWTSTVNVAKDGDRVEVVVPALEAEAGASASTTTAEPGASGGSSQATIGWIVGGAGVLAVGVGAVTGVLAIGKNDTASETCPNDGRCADRSAVDASDSAKSLATVSTIAFVAGGVLVAGGAALILTAPKSRSRGGLRMTPYADANGAGAFAMGSF